MSGAEWAVLAGGVLAIAAVVWWFFVAEATAARAAAGGTGVAQVDVVIRGGYAPATIRAKAGETLRLVFDRQDNSSCSEEVVFPDFGIRRFLPAFEKTPVELTAPKPGTYEFTCGMSMLHGRVIVE